MVSFKEAIALIEKLQRDSDTKRRKTPVPAEQERWQGGIDALTAALDVLKTVEERPLIPPVEYLPPPTEQQMVELCLAAGGEIKVAWADKDKAADYRLLWFTDEVSGTKTFRAIPKETAEVVGTALGDAKAGEQVSVMLNEAGLAALLEGRL